VRRLFFFLLASSAVACAARPAPPPTVTKAVVAVAVPAPPPSPNAESCVGVSECTSVGAGLVQTDAAAAAIALGKACRAGEQASVDACALLAGILAGPNNDTKLTAGTARIGCNLYGADTGDKPARGAACAIWGEALRDGRGTEASAPRAVRAFDDGCKLGDSHACESAKDLRAELEKKDDAERIAEGVPDANMHFGSVSAKGVTLEGVACHADDGIAGLAGAPAFGKAFSEKKRLLDRCAGTAPHKARVRWTSMSGRMTDVKVISGDDPSNRCIERALTGSRAPLAGTCALSVAVGASKR
jgi:hypothetical protein